MEIHTYMYFEKTWSTVYSHSSIVSLQRDEDRTTSFYVIHLSYEYRNLKVFDSWSASGNQTVNGLCVCTHSSQKDHINYNSACNLRFLVERYSNAYVTSYTVLHMLARTFDRSRELLNKLSFFKCK